MSARLAGALIAMLLAAGCASTPRDTVVLLPHADGTAGAVVMKQGERQALLDKPYASARSGEQGPVTGQESAETVKKRFGAALNAQPPAPKSFTVYFMLNSDDFTEESRTVVVEMLTYMQSRPSPEITVIGHTDRLGAESYNDDLSLKRAQIVKAKLVEQKVPESSITVAGRGEREPLVPTADEVAEPRNRRVEISVR